MDNKHITAIALKVFAIYLLAQFILQFPTIYGLFISISHWAGPNINPVISVPIILLFTTFIVIAILARLFWTLSNDVVEKVSGDSPSEDPKRIPDDFHEFIIFVLGLFILIEGLTNLPFSITSAFSEYATYPESKGLSGDTVVWFCTELSLVILGLSLIFKRRNWVYFYRNLKYAGTDPD